MAKDETLRPAYLILGNDRPKVRLAVSRLRARVARESGGSDLNSEVFDAETDAAQAVVDAASTPGLTLGTRLLLVLNGHKWTAKERQLLAAYVHDPMPDTCLAVEAEKLSREDALYKAVLKAAGRVAIVSCDLPKKYEMAGWVRERAHAHHLPLGAGTAKHLLDRCGSDPGHSERLEREIEKLALYCRGREASPEDVDAVCTPDDEARVFDLMDAVGRRDRVGAFSLLEMIYASGDPQDDASRVFYTLKKHVQLLEAATRLRIPDGAADAAKRLTADLGSNVHSFTAKKVLEQRRHYDRRRLGTALRALAVAETGMRGRAPATLESAAGVDHTARLVLELALGRMLA
ncbi:MAG: DNA polymerase III subunit delta [Thermoleophilia bacterium]